MEGDGDDLPTRSGLRFAIRAGLGLASFAAGFALANRFQLTHGVLYRLAANDLASAAENFAWLAAQAAMLLAAAVLLGGRLFAAAMLLAFVSALVNLCYGETLADVIDAGKLAWLVAEARQAGNAAGEFAGPLLLAALQAGLAIALFVLARWAVRRVARVPSGFLATVAGLALLLAPNLIGPPLGLPVSAAERNLYALGLEVARAEPPPPRALVRLQPNTSGTPRHIVWLIDESVAHDRFRRLISPRLERVPYLDFGLARSLSHCSAPSNLALRSGVEVRRAGPHMDLRATPSIWAYARKAGYRTLLIDGQTSGPPQNLVLPPERALIDELRPAAGALDTDLRIAEALNEQLRGPGRSFTYVVLRGVHFQYRDHYPAGLVPADSPPSLQYDTALTYSKRLFFDRLLTGVERSEVAIVYTSDHGQNLVAGALPHCSPAPVDAEFAVPLLAFLPDRLAARYAAAPREGHAASQIFPATLIWMGYDPQAVEQRYDNDLDLPPARYVRFDRNVVPLRPGEPIGVEVAMGPAPQIGQTDAISGTPSTTTSTDSGSPSRQ